MDNIDENLLNDILNKRNELLNDINSLSVYEITEHFEDSDEELKEFVIPNLIHIVKKCNVKGFDKKNITTHEALEGYNKILKYLYLANFIEINLKKEELNEDMIKRGMTKAKTIRKNMPSYLEERFNSFFCYGKNIFMTIMKEENFDEILQNSSNPITQVSYDDLKDSFTTQEIINIKNILLAYKKKFKLGNGRVIDEFLDTAIVSEGLQNVNKYKRRFKSKRKNDIDFAEIE